MSLKPFLLASTAAAALVCVAVPARASIITNQWYTGGFGDFGSGVANPGDALVGDAVTSDWATNGPILPSGTAGGTDVGGGSWLITLPYGGTIQIVDNGNSGDSFNLFDSASLLGTTSTPVDYVFNTANGTTSAGAFCGTDIGCALGDPMFSSGIFSLSSGSHTLSATLAHAGGGGSGNASFIIQANDAPPVENAPEPATLSILGLALAGLGWMKRKRRAARRLS